MLRWMADGPLLDAARASLPAARWERLSRDAGVAHGLTIWEQRLTTYAGTQRSKAVERPDHRESYERRATAALALLAEVQDLHALSVHVLQVADWQDAADRGVKLLRRTLGRRQRVDRWSSSTLDPEVPLLLEQQAYDTVLTLLQSLRDTPGPVSASAIRAALDEGLSDSVPSGTTLGRGCWSGRCARSQGPISTCCWSWAARRTPCPAASARAPCCATPIGPCSPPNSIPLASRRADARASWDSALRAAGAAHLSYPRVDTRAQRRQFASPWFLDQARLHGGPPSRPRRSTRGTWLHRG